MKNYLLPTTKDLRLKTFDLLLISLFIILLGSCKKDDNKNNYIFKSVKSGVFIVNEGPFQTGTGTISFFNRDSLTVQQDIFEKVNKRPLGNIVQSLEIFNDKAYIVVNNAGKVEVVDAMTFKSTGVIKELALPRYFIGINATKGYVSDWGNINPNIAVVDLNSLSITKTISTGTGPENMLMANGKVFVLNKGGLSFDSTITVIDSQTDNVIKTLKVFNVPSGICLDKNNKLWVLCSGRGWNGFPYPSTDTKGHLLRIDPVTLTIEKDIEFPSTEMHPDRLVINLTKDILYYNYTNGVYSFGIYDNNLQTNPDIKISKPFYGMGYDKTTNMIYGSDAIDNVQNGWVFRYDAKTNLKVDSFMVGVSPGNFYFN